MPPSRTKTIKNKHAANGSGISGSKAQRAGPMDGIVKNKKGPPPASKPSNSKAIAAILKKRRKKTYSEKELDIPKLNMITPVGVEKPKGKKKGKVFVDDRVSPPIYCTQDRLLTASFAGEHEHDSCYGASRQGGRD